MRDCLRSARREGKAARRDGERAEVQVLLPPASDALANWGTVLLQTRLLVMLLAAGLSGCVYAGGSDPRWQYATFGVDPPQGNRVTVCHAYTCKMQSPYTFSKQDLAEIQAVMAKTKRTDTRSRSAARLPTLSPLST